MVQNLPLGFKRLVKQFIELKNIKEGNGSTKRELYMGPLFCIMNYIFENKNVPKTKTGKTTAGSLQ
jgi:hypothetical protein